MTARRPFTMLASAIFLLMALAHAYRLISPFPIRVADCDVPQWVSLIGILITGGLAFALYREARR
jgi:hypothetical protein